MPPYPAETKVYLDSALGPELQYDTSLSTTDGAVAQCSIGLDHISGTEGWADCKRWRRQALGRWRLSCSAVLSVR